MTKKLSLVLASITLAIVCAFFLSGKLIQKSYYEAIAKINSQPNIKVNLLNYKRGIFVSNAELTIELGADNLADAQIIPIKQVITHGPIVAAQTPNGTRIKVLAGQLKTNLGEPWAKHLETYTTNKDALSIVTLVQFNNTASTWFHLNAADQNTPTKFHVAWDAINGLVEHDLNFAYYRGSVNLPKLQIDNPEWQFKIQNLALNLDANNKEASYSSNNSLSMQYITFIKDAKEMVKLDDIKAKLAFFTKENNLALDIEAKVLDAKILEQHFQNDVIKLQANNLNRATLANMPRFTALSTKATIDLLQDLTVASTDVTLELPKHFTEAFLSYVSFELYRTSYLGKFDHRPANAVLQDISGSINKLVQGAVKKELFLDNGTHYALNFNRSPQG